LALHLWNESVLRSVPLVHEHGISPLTPLLGQLFDAHTVTEDWFAGAGLGNSEHCQVNTTKEITHETSTLGR